MAWTNLTSPYTALLFFRSPRSLPISHISTFLCAMLTGEMLKIPSLHPANPASRGLTKSWTRCGNSSIYYRAPPPTGPRLPARPAPHLRSLVEAHRAVVGAQSARSVGAVRSPAVLGHGCPAPLSFARSAATLWSSPGATEPAPPARSPPASCEELGTSSRAAGGSRAPAYYPACRLATAKPWSRGEWGKTNTSSSHPDFVTGLGRDGVTAFLSQRQIASLFRLHPTFTSGRLPLRV